MLDLKPAQRADSRTRKLAMVAIAMGALVVLYLVGNSIVVSDHGVELARLNHELLLQHSQALQKEAAEVKRIEADETRLCAAARATQYTPIISILCDYEGSSFVTPSASKPTGASGTVTATPAPSESRASPTAEPTVTPSPKPLPTPSPSCTVNLLGICI